MSEVKRFSGNYIPGHPPAIVTDPNGLLCLYSELDIERIAHAETKKRLEESEAKIKCLLERETELESQLNELNIERLKPFVLRSEMENMKSIMQIMIDERQERLEELEGAIGQSVETGKDALWWEIPWVENQTIQQAIQNSQARQGK